MRVKNIWHYFTRYARGRSLLIAIIALLILYKQLVNWSDFFSFLVGFATELLGIAITFFFIESIIRHAKDREDVKSLSWSLLHDIDYISWVWLGGKRIFDVGELDKLLSNIEKSDQLHPSTQNLILDLGNKAYEWHRSKKKYCELNPNFEKALAELEQLATIRDDDKIEILEEVAKPLKKAVSYLYQIVDTEEYAKITEVKKDSRINSQFWRLEGEIVKTE